MVGGVALLSAFQRNGGLVGGWIYDVFDFQFTFSKWGVVLAETFVAMPFLVITVEAGLRSMDRRYEDAAASLGAGRWTVFRRVTVPLIAPALIAGCRVGVGTRAGRVRCDDHLRRQHPGAHADDCRSRSTTSSRRNRAWRSCSAWCCSRSRSSCSCRSATTGSGGCVTLAADVGVRLG